MDARNHGLRAMLHAPAQAGRLDDAHLLQGMLDFELALADAESACGLLPADTGTRLRAAAQDFTVDAGTLGTEARAGGTLAIPFVKRLTTHVAARDAEAAKWVHWGATSQDLVDTATVLAARRAHAALRATVQVAGDAAARLAEAHVGTPMAGRTLLQPAVPVSFGWKAAGWLEAIRRVRLDLDALDARGWPLQFGGAAGTLAALDGQGARVAVELATRLGLAPAPVSWHGHRDQPARWGLAWALAGGALAKVARDVSLLMQPEVAEAAEPGGAGKGGSSAMPHKVNPVLSMLALEAGLRLPGLAATLLSDLPGEHERGLGHWQHTAFVLGDIAQAAGSAVSAVAELLDGLRVDAARMARNMEATGGFVYAESLSQRLGARLGKAAAHARIEALCRDAVAHGLSLPEATRRAAAGDAVLAEALAGTDPFDPAPLLRDATAMTHAALAAWRA